MIDHQPSGASVLHKKGDKMITSLGDDLVEEMNFILEEQYAKPFAEKGIDFRKQTVFMEILVGVDDDPEKTWERIEITRKVFEDYYGDDRPAGLIYPVSWIPNMDSIIEPQPRVVSGDVDITRSGTRREELLFKKEDLTKVNVLRRIISPMGTMDGIEFLMSKLKNTKNNADFFVSMNKPAK